MGGGGWCGGRGEGERKKEGAREGNRAGCSAEMEPCSQHRLPWGFDTAQPLNAWSRAILAAIVNAGIVGVPEHAPRGMRACGSSDHGRCQRLPERGVRDAATRPLRQVGSLVGGA